MVLEAISIIAQASSQQHDLEILLHTIMARDDEAKAALIPVWQQQAQQALKPSPDQDQSRPSSTAPTIVHESGGSAADTSGATAIDEDQASIQSKKSSYSKEEVRQFLKDTSVKDAPDDKKREFLELKGVPKEAVNEVLHELAMQSVKEDTTVSAAASKFDVSQFNRQHRDSPPIVTYPEFLVKPQKPPPLVTANRLFNTAYIVGSLATVFWGASRYLIEPMAAELTAARHELSNHSAEKTNDLNRRLESLVSSIPPVAKSLPLMASTTISDQESITSDPTELFHRDIGIQTSPIISRRNSTSSSSSSPSWEEEVKLVSMTKKHEDRLQSLRSHLDDILDGEVRGREGNTNLENSIGELREYLNELVYMPPKGIGIDAWGATGGTKREGEKVDAIAAFKGEIRGVKGMLLSARRFPASNAV